MKLLIQYAFSFLHQPYKWGGDDPTGFDCSGLVQEILKSVGADPPGDQTAHELFKFFQKYGTPCGATPGALAFFGTPQKIKHVGFCIDHIRMIDAAGGGPKVETLSDAAQHNAFVKLSLIERRPDFLTCYKPTYKRLTPIV